MESVPLLYRHQFPDPMTSMNWSGWIQSSSAPGPTNSSSSSPDDNEAPEPRHTSLDLNGALLMAGSRPVTVTLDRDPRSESSQSRSRMSFRVVSVRTGVRARSARVGTYWSIPASLIHMPQSVALLIFVSSSDAGCGSMPGPASMSPMWMTLDRSSTAEGAQPRDANSCDAVAGCDTCKPATRVAVSPDVRTEDMAVPPMVPVPVAAAPALVLSVTAPPLTNAVTMVAAPSPTRHASVPLIRRIAVRADVTASDTVFDDP